MITILYNFICKVLSPFRLTGPIFDKELRVSSRRSRNYILRFAYVALLTAFLVLVWIEAMGQSGSSLYRISRMAETGKFIVICVVWFQFCATQFLAIILLSNSIGDEIYHRTLGLLMTTPINSFQIVMGKLLSKLLQLVLLLAISLPLLAIIRVMGGVPWNYVISSLCITLTTVIFVGSLSLFYSIFCRRAYAVIIMTIMTLSTIFALLPLGCDIGKKFIYLNLYAKSLLQHVYQFHHDGRTSLGSGSYLFLMAFTLRHRAGCIGTSIICLGDCSS